MYRLFSRGRQEITVSLMIECMVDGCGSEPDDRLTVNSNGLLLVYAICSEHAQDFRWGAIAVTPAEVTRGLIGPAVS
jgi:hypothetical protein